MTTWHLSSWRLENLRKLPALHLLPWTCFIAGILSAPKVPSTIPQDTVNPEPIPRINATVLDHTGHDLTSSFRVMLYHPQAALDLNHSLSGRSAPRSRPLTECPTGIFHESFCTPENNKAGSLQSYRIICHVVVPMTYTAGDTANALLTGFIPDQTVKSRPRNGHCAENEICVPGRGAATSRSGRLVASCVSTQLFVEYASWDNQGQQGLDLGGMSASMVLSQLDGSTPKEVDAFQIDGAANTGNHLQKKSCRDCMELTSGEFGSGTESLDVEATLLTTGALAGLLWLAITSG